MTLMQYSKLAPYYDLLGWADFTYHLWPHLRDFFRLIDSTPLRFLDIACGTGMLTSILSDMMNTHVTGIDISPEMITVARSKKYHIKPNFSVLDMRRFDLGKTFPVIGCFYDSLNHLIREDDVRNAFVCASKHTEQGGYYLFDVNTALGLRNWRPYYSQKKGKFFVCQTADYNPKTKIGTCKIEAFVKRRDGKVEIIEETIKEKAYSLRFLKYALATAGFKQIVFKPFISSDSIKESGRLFVICKK